MLRVHPQDSMSETPSHPFRTGERYENRRGLFEVVSINGDSVQIRWDTGEVVNTSVDLQAKILRNMEKELTDAAAQKRKRTPKSFGEFFRGLRTEDFSEDVTGTLWRSREQLGGAVTRLLEVKELFNSWSIYGRPEVHWASVSRYGLNHPSLQSKFFARINQEHILFGLYVERSDKRTDYQDDWIKFVSWCENRENLRWLHAAMLCTKAVLVNPYEGWPDLSFNGTIEPTGEGFSWNRGGEITNVARDDLPEVLKSLPADLWLNAVLGRVLSKDAAVAEGERIASAIAEWLNTLLPIYQDQPARGGCIAISGGASRADHFSHPLLWKRHALRKTLRLPGEPDRQKQIAGGEPRAPARCWEQARPRRRLWIGNC
jgi:hypothetical protein